MITQGTEFEQVNSLVTATIADCQMTGLQMQEVVNELTQRLRYDNAVDFLLDMTQVQFLSSDCLGVLVTFLTDVEQLRGRIVLVNCHPNVAFLFKVTRLDAVFALYDDIDEALAHMAHG